MVRFLVLLMWVIASAGFGVGCDDGSQTTVGGTGGSTGSPDPGVPGAVFDVAEFDTTPGGIFRVLGSTGSGGLGAPVAAGGGDADGDGFADLALASFLASPFDRDRAGEVYLAFGNGTTAGEVDTAGLSAAVMKIAGAGPQETLGNEVWMDDVTGDGIADLLVCRQNFQPNDTRLGAGALTIIAGGPELREQAESLSYVDLASPPAALTITTLVGANALDRLGIWVRTADVTGDGILDVIVGADQEDERGTNSGAVYVIRGGPHLAQTQTIDLANFGTTSVAGDLARILPPEGADRYHLGATCDGADLDGNGRAEVLVSAAFNRSGGAVDPFGAPGAAEASGGTERGTLFILWDDNFSANPWPDGFTIGVDSAPGDTSTISGSSLHRSFGEELNGGLDFDADGTADLFVGDLVGDLAPDNRPQGGVGHLFFDASSLRGRTFDMGNLPEDLVVTTILGSAPGVLSSDTSVIGDFDGDGIGDVATGSPKSNPAGRTIAGTIDVVFGSPDGWPPVIDLRSPGEVEEVRIVTIYGAKGTVGGDQGDMICYSAAGGDIDGDGLDDIVTNEMLGNGSDPAAIDVGNLVVISGAHLAAATE
ncbi:MAG: hypothetical protein AAF500_05220 [Myxococcota bacterium]